MTPTNQDSPNTAGAGELKACPNPWCDLDEPSVSRNNALGRWTWQVECLCGTSDGELHETEADAIAAWNTRPTPAAPEMAHALELARCIIAKNIGDYHGILGHIEKVQAKARGEA